MKHIIAYILLSLALGIAVTTIIGYVTPATYLRSWGHMFGSIEMALPSAIALLLVCIANMVVMLPIGGCDPVAKTKPTPTPPQALGFSRRETLAALACLVMAIVTITATVQSSADENRRMELEQREARLIDREAELETIKARYTASLVNQRRYVESVRDGLGWTGTIITMFARRPNDT